MFKRTRWTWRPDPTWRLIDAIENLTLAVTRLAEAVEKQKPKTIVMQGGRIHFPLPEEGIMYIVEATHADVAYTITEPTATDAEGNPVPVADLLLEATSDNPAAVELLPTDELTGVAHFGAPGLANVNVTVKLPDGTLVGSFGAQFTITAGPASAISGGTITFEGLTDQ